MDVVFDAQEAARTVMAGKVEQAVEAASAWEQTSAAWLWLYFNDDSVTGPDGAYVSPKEKVLQWVEAKGLDLLNLTEAEVVAKVRAYLGAWARRAKQLTVERRAEAAWSLPSNLDWPDMLSEMAEADRVARRGVRRRVGIAPAPTVEPNTSLIGGVNPSEFLGDFYIRVADNLGDLKVDRKTRVARMASFAVEEKERGEAPPQQAAHHAGRKRESRMSYEMLQDAAHSGNWTLEDERVMGLR